jgi:hypothetical protein
MRAPDGVSSWGSFCPERWDEAHRLSLLSEVVMPPDRLGYFDEKLRGANLKWVGISG